MKKNFIILIIGIALIGIGAVVTVFELADYEFIDEAYYNDKYVQYEERTFDITSPHCIEIELPLDDRHDNYKIIYDENVQIGTIKIKYAYLEGIYDLEIKNRNKPGQCQEIDIDIETSNNGVKIKEFVSDIVKNLQEKKIYNYAKIIYEDIEITVNPFNQAIINVD